MPLRGEDGLFGALEEALKAADRPLDCHDLFDVPKVRSHAATVNRVSDYLGHLWRKGLVVRLPAAKEDGKRSRWVYAWKAKVPKPKVTMKDASEFLGGLPLLKRPNIEISEEGKNIVISLPGLSITIRQD